MKKKLIISLFIFMISSMLFSQSLELETGLKTAFAKTENELDYTYFSTDFLDLPYLIAGPVRLTYVFDCSEKWSLGTGVSLYIYPFQALAANLNASYKLTTFKNNSSLEIKTLMDLGILHLTTEYFDTNVLSKVREENFSLMTACFLQLVCRWQKPFKGTIAFGPCLASATVNDILYIFYGTDLTFGITFSL